MFDHFHEWDTQNDKLIYFFQSTCNILGVLPNEIINLNNFNNFIELCNWFIINFFDDYKKKLINILEIGFSLENVKLLNRFMKKNNMNSIFDTPEYFKTVFDNLILTKYAVLFVWNNDIANILNYKPFNFFEITYEIALLLY
jgi:hypothetical protein